MTSHTRILALESIDLKRLVADIEANANDPDPLRTDADKLVAIRTAIASRVDIDDLRELLAMLGPDEDV